MICCVAGARFHAEPSLCGLCSYHVPRPHAPRCQPSYLKADQGHPGPSVQCLFCLAFLWIFILVFFIPEMIPPLLLSTSSRVSWSSSSCLSFWSSKPPLDIFFSLGSTGIWGDQIDTLHGFHCEQSQDLRYVVSVHLVQAYSPVATFWMFRHVTSDTSGMFLHLGGCLLLQTPASLDLVLVLSLADQSVCACVLQLLGVIDARCLLCRLQMEKQGLFLLKEELEEIFLLFLAVEIILDILHFFFVMLPFISIKYLCGFPLCKYFSISKCTKGPFKQRKDFFF